MATKRQKKQERKRKKRKDKRREIHTQRSLGLAAQMQRAATVPIHECLMYAGLPEEGIGEVIFSRRLPDRQLATAFFLVDIYCLGVKDAFGRMLTGAEFAEFQETLTAQRDEGFITIDAPSARRLVEQAVDYAGSLGFSPHNDYRKVVPIFSDVDPDQGEDLCEFGRDGKPFFVGGPYDSTERCRQVINTLNERCGPDGFHYFVPVDKSEIGEEFRSLDFEDDEDGILYFSDDKHE